ncbi:hypothetical protein AVEN_111185-1 [Araneus ventricosus]|uniref:Uncharacterized protein n=1 Tax=Araneus ventricosus TaxID=182803 RepID=A0A4Y2RRE8_ARAVE|nr:hypothetical protein AVEN_111185-1 [Araneus ventricosus]
MSLCNYPCHCKSDCDILLDEFWYKSQWVRDLISKTISSDHEQDAWSLQPFHPTLFPFLAHLFRQIIYGHSTQCKSIRSISYSAYFSPRLLRCPLEQRFPTCATRTPRDTQGPVRGTRKLFW